MGTWRRKARAADDDRYSLPTIDDLRLMETEEQEELVQSFERTYTQHSYIWRSLFQALLCCYILFLGYSVFEQFRDPWQLRFHAYFMNEASSAMVIFADFMAMVACMLEVIALSSRCKYPIQYVWSSCLLGIIVAVFWLYQMLRLNKFRWDVIWLPISPLCGTILSHYVNHLLAESQREISKLRASMYHYKRR